MGSVQRGIVVLLVLTCGLETTVLAAGLSWRKLQKVQPGTELRVEGHGKRIFVAADESALYVLNLEDLTLPERVQSSLKNWVNDNPASLGALRRDATITGLPHGVRLQPDGIYVDDSKIAELTAILQTIDRASLKSDAVSDSNRRRANIGIVTAITTGCLILLMVAMINAAAH